MKEVQPALAAIDAGSNTIHLVVARPSAHGRALRTLDDQLELVRLGADVSASGAIGPERAARAIAAIRQQAARAHALGAQTVLGIATEGVRAATNSTEFLGRVAAETGVRLALVTGDQEAALTYWGAISALGAASAAGRRAVLDLGGGSLEIVVGSGDAIEWRVSLPLGSGAIHDRYAPADPPTERELTGARQAAASLLAPLAAPLPVDEALVCGGTATALAVLANRALGESGLPAGANEENEKNGATRALSQHQLEALVELLRAHPAAEVAARYTMDEARARLLGAGAVVLQATMERLGVTTLRVSRRGIREGALVAYLRAGDQWLEVAAAAVLPPDVQVNR